MRIVKNGFMHWNLYFSQRSSSMTQAHLCLNANLIYFSKSLSSSKISSSWQTGTILFLVNFNKEETLEMPSCVLQKPPSRGALRKRCSDNMQQIYRRTLIPKGNFMPKCEITLRHGCSPVNLLHIFRTPFLKNTSGRFLLILSNWTSTNENTNNAFVNLLSQFSDFLSKTSFTKSTVT